MFPRKRFRMSSCRRFHVNGSREREEHNSKSAPSLACIRSLPFEVTDTLLEVRPNGTLDSQTVSDRFL